MDNKDTKPMGTFAKLMQSTPPATQLPVQPQKPVEPPKPEVKEPKPTVEIEKKESKPTVKTIKQEAKTQESKQLLGARITKQQYTCLLYTSPSPRDGLLSRMPSSA